MKNPCINCTIEKEGCKEAFCFARKVHETQMKEKKKRIEAEERRQRLLDYYIAGRVMQDKERHARRGEW